MPAVLVLRQHDRFTTVLEQYGIEAVNLEVIRTEPFEDLTPLRAALDGPVRYDGFFVTSPAAASVVIEVLKTLGCEHSGMIYVLGERSKKLFTDAGINVEYCASANTAEDLISEFTEAEFAGKRLCFVRGDRSMRTIPDLLRGRAEVDELIVYRTIETVPNEGIVSDVRERLGSGDIEWVCFFSPSAVDAFDSLLGGARGLKAAVIGDTTAERARQSGFDVAFISPRSNADDFAHGFVEQVKTIG